ncbi:MAG: hypothetical protein KUG78_00020 [Kangiellaceae bacterium]|nr:hypothetical protein [Kangiellaceae bacterium]
MKKESRNKIFSLVLLGILTASMTGCKTTTSVTYKKQNTITGDSEEANVTFSTGGNNIGGDEQTNREQQEENDGNGASDMKIDLSESSVFLLRNNPSITFSLTYYGMTQHSKTFDAKVIGNTLIFANPTAVDSWAEPYLDSTTGTLLQANITVTRHTGTNRLVAKVYSGKQLISSAITSKYVTGGVGDDPIELCPDPWSCQQQ